MSRFLLACTPAEGHVIPLAAVAEHLVLEGHDVTFLAGHRFADLVGGTGASFVPLPWECDWDDRDQDAAFPDRAGLRRVPQILFDVQHAFCNPMPHQAKAVAEILRQSPVDAIVVDNFFTGVAP